MSCTFKFESVNHMRIRSKIIRLEIILLFFHVGTVVKHQCATLVILAWTHPAVISNSPPGCRASRSATIASSPRAGTPKRKKKCSVTSNNSGGQPMSFSETVFVTWHGYVIGVGVVKTSIPLLHTVQSMSCETTLIVFRRSKFPPWVESTVRCVTQSGNYW